MLSSTEIKELCKTAAVANVNKEILEGGIVIYRCTDGKKFFKQFQAENCQLKIEEIIYAQSANS